MSNPQIESTLAALVQDVAGIRETNRLLGEVLTQMRREPYDGIEEAQKRAMGQIHYFEVEGRTTRDFELYAPWVRLTCTIKQSGWRSGHGNAGLVWVNGSAHPLRFPGMPEADTSGSHESANLQENVTRSMVLDMPIYHLRVEGTLIAGVIQVVFCPGGRIIEEVLAPRDTMESYLTYIREAVEATQAAVETGGDSELRLAAIEAACVAIQAAVEPMELTICHDNPAPQNVT